MPNTKPTEIYGSNVFSDKVMKERLPRIVYKSLRKTIEQGTNSILRWRTSWLPP